MTFRTRASVGLVIATLLVGALAALPGMSDPPTTTTVASVGDAAAPDTVDSSTPGTELTASTSTTSTSTSTTAPVPRPPRKPAVVATKPVGDYPAGTVMSGPVEIAGVVRDDKGVPIADACVTIGLGPGHVPIANVRTGPDGAFGGSFDLDATAEWAYVAARDCSGAVPGFARQRVSVLVKPAQTYDVPITAPPGSALRGKLAHASTGEALVDRCVGVSMNPIDTAWVRTNANGEWVVPDLPLGRYGFDVKTPEAPGCSFVNGASLRIERVINRDSGAVRYDKIGDITKAGSVDNLDIYVST